MLNYREFIKTSWPLLAFGFASVFWGNFGQSFFISWYGTPIQESLDLSAGRYGSIYALATLGSGLLIMVFGGLIDSWPLRRFALVSALGLLAACLALANAVNEFMLLLGFFLIRLCGQGLLPHTAQTTMARYFDSNRGKALSIAASGIPTGEIVLPLLAVALINMIGWRMSWLVLAITIVALYLPLIFWLLERSDIDTDISPVPAANETNMKAAGRREVLADYRFWLALPALLAGPFIITGVFIHQGFIIQQKGWSPAWLATWFVVYGAVHWLTSMLTGILIDRFNARFLLRLLLIPLVVAQFALTLFEGLWVAPVFLMLLGVTIGATNPISGALWAEAYGTARLGSIRSLMTSLIVLSTAVSPYALGVLIDRSLALETIFSGTAWGTVGAALLVQLSYRPELARKS